MQTMVQQRSMVRTLVATISRRILSLATQLLRWLNMVVFTIGMPSMIQGQFAHQVGTCHRIRSGQVWYLSGAALQYQETPSSQRMVGLIRGMEPISVDSQDCREVKEKTILVTTRLQDKEVLGGPPLLMLICLAIES